MVVMIIYFLIGAFAGLMSGMIGIGGGVIVVPLLALVFNKLDYNSAVIMHLAAGTSLACMVITSARALYEHNKRHVDFWDIYKQLVPGLIIGTVLGVFLAHFLYSKVLSILFGIFLLLNAMKMFLQPHKTGHTLPHRWGMSGMGFAIGTPSGLLGISGSTFSIPFLVHCNVDMRSVILVSLAVSFTVALIGSICVFITGSFATGLPAHTIGYIYYPAWFFVTLGSVIILPLGVSLSHRLPVIVLKRVFSVLLLVLAIHMLWW